MTYATLQDLQTLCGERELIQLTDRSDPPVDAIDEDIVQAALAWADGRINSYVAAAYTLPLVTNPPLLTDLACDLARFRLYKEAAPHEVKSRHDEALKMLQQIAGGRAKIPGVAGDEPQIRSGLKVQADLAVFDNITLASF